MGSVWSVLALVVGAIGAGVAILLYLDARKELASARRSLARRGAQPLGPRRAARPPEAIRHELTVPPELVNALGEGMCIAFVGDRVTAELGVPTHAQALAGVAADAAAKGVAGPWAALHEQLTAGDETLAATVLRSRMGDAGLLRAMRLNMERHRRSSFSAHLEDLFTSPTATLKTLAELPLAGVVTDDWSGVVAEHFERSQPLRLTPWQSGDFDAILRSGTPFVVEAFGSVQSRRLLLTDDDHRDAIDRNRDYARFIETLLTAYAVLYVGVSPERIRSFLTTAGVKRGAISPQWALVPWERNFELHAEVFQEVHGVEWLMVVNEEAQQEFARRLLYSEEVRGAIQRRVRASPRVGEIGRLARLKLENIGPFEQLDLPLGGERTILLGDNGSGKTTILRAAALALVGETPERETLAQRMLRAGCSSGSIELTIDKHAYRTELRRERGRVYAYSQQFTPVQAGLWLVMGFPPLRGLSRTNPPGPAQAGHEGPSPDDLLPLLRADPDERLDDLKQWIVNVATAGEMSPDDRSAQSLLTDFFEIVAELVPGIPFSFAGIDKETWDIKLDSPDGPITFDALSQGMMGVLAWVGILLKRLYEVHGHSAGPLKRPALVLIDEIDLHLHPEWQRAILPLLRRRFPQLQLLATTHSPLVVSSAVGEQIVRLGRERDGRPEALEMPHSFKGLTSDEVLTSAAFELDTPLDLETDGDVREYTALLAKGETPERNVRAAELAERLGEPQVARTPWESEAAELFREWLAQRLHDEPPERRERLLGEAQRYLARLRTDAEG
ncbi:MAG TPA: AAA family ATPase [Conexibacter sp.]|nr:AAA family ATPase [Conexibacter sp.]